MNKLFSYIPADQSSFFYQFCSLLLEDYKGFSVLKVNYNLKYYNCFDSSFDLNLCCFNFIINIDFHIGLGLSLFNYFFL